MPSTKHSKKIRAAFLQPSCLLVFGDAVSFSDTDPEALIRNVRRLVADELKVDIRTVKVTGIGSDLNSGNAIMDVAVNPNRSKKIHPNAIRLTIEARQPRNGEKFRIVAPPTCGCIGECSYAC